VAQKTQLQPSGLPGRAYVTPFQKSGTAGNRELGRLTQLGVAGTPTRTYGTFTKEEFTETFKSNKRFTQLSAVALPAKRYKVFEEGASIRSGVTLSISVDAALAKASNNDIAGSTALSLSPQATTLEFTGAGDTYTVAADVTTTLETAATLLKFNPYLTFSGGTELSFSTSSTLNFTTGYEFTGDVTTTFTVGATTDFTANYDVTSDVTLSLTPTASSLSYSAVGSTTSILGSTTLLLFPGGATSLNGEVAGRSGKIRRNHGPNKLGRIR